VQQVWDATVDAIMIAADYLKRIAAWSRELNEREIEVARAGIVERSYRANEYIFMRGDPFDYWTGIVTGLARMGTVSSGGKAVTLAGMTAGAWFGEGSMLKSELRRYDVVALRDTRLALMDRSTFFWLFENSVAFNRFLVRQLNERVGQFIGALEHGRALDAAGEGRLAAARIWRRHHHRTRTLAPSWRVSAASTSSSEKAPYCGPLSLLCSRPIRHRIESRKRK
jgi:CRP/FNR family transcriptional regulator, cyclic AMP receptor protein